MSFFKYIKLKDFRNFHEYENDYNKNCNIIYGKNGSGKTNLLESISLFDKGTGFKNDNLKNIIRSKKEKFINFAQFYSSNKLYELKVFTLQTNERLLKKILVNDDNNKEALTHLRSMLSFLIFQPEMERFFLLSPSFRRKFIDRLIYSYNKDYNQLINQYKKNLSERSNILKSQRIDDAGLQKIEDNIARLGIEIYDHRIKQINILNDNLISLFKQKKSPFSVKLKIEDTFLNKNNSNINDVDKYKNQLKINRQNDSFVGGATIGPHRSDISGLINNDFPLNQLSTGQQKTIVLMLILAQSDYLVNKRHIRPIILMDEICSHLDDINRSILLNLVQDFDLQFFMTGTDKNLFSFLSTKTKYYNISNSGKK